MIPTRIAAITPFCDCGRWEFTTARSSIVDTLHQRARALSYQQMPIHGHPARQRYASTSSYYASDMHIQETRRSLPTPHELH